MANRNTDREQPPPNPFLLSSATTTTTTTTNTTTTTIASLFSHTPGPGEASHVASSSPTMSSVSSRASPSITPQLFTTLGQTKGFLAPGSSSVASAPSSGIAFTSDAVTKDVAAATPSNIFGSGHTMTTPTPSTHLWGTKTTSDTAPVLGDLGAVDPVLPSSSSVSSVFGGATSVLGSGFGAAVPTPKVFGSSEVATPVFTTTAGNGQEGQVPLFGQFRVPSTSQTDPFKARVDEARPLPVPSTHQERDVGGSPSKVFSGTSGAASKPIPSLFSKAVLSAFGSLEGKANPTRSPVKEQEETVSSNKAKLHKSKAQDKGQSFSPPDYNKKEVTKIIVAEIPDSCMDKDFLKTHFSKFGDIKRLMLNVRSHQATVLFHTHNAASKAKRKGCKLHPMLPVVKIFYGTPARRRSEDTGSSDAVQAKKKAIRTLQQVQTSDLDPYTPLQRPGTEPLPLPFKKPAKIKTVRSSPKAEPAIPPLAASHLSVVKKKIRNKSPGREAKEPTTVNTDEGNLLAALDCVAQNNNDRYTILKTRDKLLRKERHRTSDLHEASYLAATCPDMCPELERYMRDVQYDLSSTFEMTNGVLDHRLVTKRFSRSSADKELPLPHELRPGPVLLQTMDFLVCNVIDRVDEDGMEKDVWYNYLWNRTRAVRNDLMQQQLVSGDAVTIMERCTRFHIYAAALLCEEPPDLYDDKMNTEHLTKSLQTLKELYHDLGEQGQHFASEPEFRAYEMLLSLNDGEAIVNKYAQFRDEVQKSNPVQFALKVILAVTFNNYVKFFRLVRESATYLQGCLLHRYFRQVRSRALQTIVKSYMPPKGRQAIPLPTIVRILGFENDVETVVYLKCHGINTTEGSVSLDKHSFIHTPEELPPLVRPISLVEVNRAVSVGEVVQGGLIPSNPLHTHIPHDSFDEQGRLKPGARDASDQSRAVGNVPLDISLAPVVQQPVAMQNYELVSHMKDIYSMVEGAVLPQMVREVSMLVVQDVVAQSVALDLVMEGVQQEVKQVGWEGYREVEQEEIDRRRRQREKQEREKKALEQMRLKVADQLYSECSGQFVESLVKQVCEEAVWEVSEETALKELTKELPYRWCEEVVVDEITALSREAIQELVAEQEHKVEVFMRKVALRRIAEHFQVWRLQTQKAGQRKQSQLTFPAACSGLSLCQQSQALGWGYARDPEHNMSAPQLAHLENTIKDCLKKLTVKNWLMKECAWHPLPLRHRLATLVKGPPPEQHNLMTQYFKVLVCWEETVSPEILLWLRSKLGGQQEGRGAGPGVAQDIMQPLNMSFTFVSQQNGLEYAWVMREVSASSLVASDLSGTALLLYVSSGRSGGDSCRGRVREMLLELPGASFFQINFEGGCEAREGWSLVEEDLVKPQTSERLQSLLLGFWQQQREQVFVASAHLNDLANDIVAQHFLEPALRKHSERAADGRSPLPPEALIDLYNSVLDTLKLAVADNELCALSWPPPELSHLTQTPSPTWNTTDATRASQLVASMRLPPLHMEEATSTTTTTTWASLTGLLHCYAAAIPGPEGEAPVLVSHMDGVLGQARVSLEHLLCDNIDEEMFTHFEIHPLLAPWPQLIYACASYKLSGLPATRVYYQPKRLCHFPCPASWVAACRFSHPGWGQAVQENLASSSRKRKACRDEEEQERKATKTTMVIHSKLLEDIAAEKEKCALFEKNLEGMLDIEEELKLLFESTY